MPPKDDDKVKWGHGKICLASEKARTFWLDCLRDNTLDNLTLWQHLIWRQQKHGRSSKCAGDMMTTWRLVGHNEATLRNLCQEKLPASQNALKLLLMKELDGITNVPESHSITELIDETTEYFLPAEDADSQLVKIRSSVTEPELGIKRPHQLQWTPSDPHGHPGSEEWLLPSPPQLYPMAGHQPILGTSHMIGAPLPAQSLLASYPPMRRIHDQSPHMVPGLQQPMEPPQFHQMPGLQPATGMSGMMVAPSLAMVPLSQTKETRSSVSHVSMSELDLRVAADTFLERVKKPSYRQCTNSLKKFKEYIFKGLSRDSECKNVDAKKLWLVAGEVTTELSQSGVHFDSLLQVYNDLGSQSVVDLVIGKLAFKNFGFGISSRQVALMAPQFLRLSTELGSTRKRSHEGELYPAYPPQQMGPPMLYSDGPLPMAGLPPFAGPPPMTGAPPTAGHGLPFLTGPPPMSGLPLVSGPPPTIQPIKPWLEDSKSPWTIKSTSIPEPTKIMVGNHSLALHFLDCFGPLDRDLFYHVTKDACKYDGLKNPEHVILLVYGNDKSNLKWTTRLRLQQMYGNQMDYISLSDPHPRPFNVHPGAIKTPVLATNRPIALRDAIVKGICLVGLPQTDQYDCFKYLDELMAAADEAKRRIGKRRIVCLRLFLHKGNVRSLESFREWCVTNGHEVPPP
jgi:hypothetical protein